MVLKSRVIIKDARLCCQVWSWSLFHCLHGKGSPRGRWPNYWALATHTSHPDEAPGSWIWPDPLPVIMAFEGINQWMKFCLSLSFCTPFLQIRK